jgi:hypothetical protein
LSLRRTRQAGTAECGVATVAKPSSSERSRQQQVGDAIGARQRGIFHPHTEAVHPPPARADEHGACFADEPDAEAAALGHEARARVQIAGLVARPGRRATRPAVASGPAARRRLGSSTLAPRLA